MRKICFDLDGTLFDSQTEMLNQAAKKLDKELKLTDWTTYNPKHCFDAETYKGLKEVWTNEKVYQNTREMLGASSCFKTLRANNFYIIVSTFSGGDNFGDLTRYKKDCLVKHKMVPDEFISSEDVKPDIECDYLVEDCIENLLNSSAPNKFLITRPWNINEDLTGTGINRIDCVSDLLSFIMDLSVTVC